MGICAYLENGSIVGGRVTGEVSVTSSCGSVRENDAVDGGDSRESERSDGDEGEHVVKDVCVWVGFDAKEWSGL